MASAPSMAADLYEEILDHGLDAGRALALADALEREGRFLEAIETLAQANRLQQDDALERRLIRARGAAFAQFDRSVPAPVWPRAYPRTLPASRSDRRSSRPPSSPPACF